MTVTVDLNVLLDVFQRRQPHYAASARVIDLVETGNVLSVCPAHGLTTLYYVIRKHAPKPDAEAAMDRVLCHFQIGNLNAAGWQAARKLPLADFEDAVVSTVAKTTASAFIVTRNARDFAGSAVPPSRRRIFSVNLPSSPDATPIVTVGSKRLLAADPLLTLQTLFHPAGWYQ